MNEDFPNTELSPANSEYKVPPAVHDKGRSGSPARKESLNNSVVLAAHKISPTPNVSRKPNTFSRPNAKKIVLSSDEEDNIELL